MVVVRRQTFLLIFNLLTVAAASGAELVCNGTFDERGGWTPDGKMFRIDERCGQNGTGGLAWESSDPNLYRLVAQSLKFVAGYSQQMTLGFDRPK